MHFTLSDEQNMVADSVAKFTDARYGLDRRRQWLQEPAGFSMENWRQLAGLGLTALPFPAAVGGLDGTALDISVVMEQLGRGLVVEPYLACVLLAGPLAPPDHQQAIAEGGRLVALAHAERAGRFNWRWCATTARRHGDGWQLVGEKTLALGAMAADVLLVVARTSGARADGDGLSLFCVDPAQPGVERRGWRAVDGSLVGDVRLHSAALPATALVGGEGQAWPALEHAYAAASLALCSEAIGVMDVLLAQTLDYVKTRQQFGQPLGRFQVIQHRLADCYMQLEQARSLTLKAVLTSQDDKAAWQRAVAGAKAYVSEAALMIGHEAIQFHGGMGMTDELAISHYHKRLVMITTLFGDGPFQLDRYASLSAGAAA